MTKWRLTTEEQQFASENYGLVHSFLRRKKLDESDYFDIVIFGYLKAVRKYMNDPDLPRFAFSTIAWRKMGDCVYEYHQYLNRPKRRGVTISLESVNPKNKSLSLNDIISAPSTEFIDVEIELLMLEIASKLSERQMQILRLKMDGYGINEIAEKQQTTIYDIRTSLDKARKVVVVVCGG